MHELVYLVLGGSMRCLIYTLKLADLSGEVRGLVDTPRESFGMVLY